MRLTNDWKDYILLDAGNGEKLESWNGVILRRPDPQAMWPTFEKKNMEKCRWILSQK